MNNSVRQLNLQLQATPNGAANPSLRAVSEAADRQRQHDLALLQERERLNRAAADNAQRRENVRNAERQRDAINAKEQQLQRLQSSVDWWDKQLTDARVNGRDPRWLSQQRDNALKQKHDYQHR
jgi:hypothetical protein